jgi:hypothetical protein
MTVAASPAHATTHEVGSSSGYDQMILEPSAVENRVSEEEDYFGPQRIQDRMKMYAQGAGLPMDFLHRYNEENKNRSG